MRAFEIHTFRGGKWKIDSVFDDRDLAMFEAKRMDSSNRFPGVRVVEEIFDEVQSKTMTKTIFRGSSGAEAVVAAPAATGRAKPAAKGATRAAARARGARGKVRARRPPKKKSGSLGPLMIFGAVVAIGGAAMYGLRYFQAFQ